MSTPGSHTTPSTASGVIFTDCGLLNSAAKRAPARKRSKSSTGRLPVLIKGKRVRTIIQSGSRAKVARWSIQSISPEPMK